MRILFARSRENATRRCAFPFENVFWAGNLELDRIPAAAKWLRQSRLKVAYISLHKYTGITVEDITRLFLVGRDVRLLELG